MFGRLRKRREESGTAPAGATEVREIALAAEVAAGARAREAVIAQHEHVLRCLREELERYVMAQTGIDLARESWELDGRGGVLRRID